MRRALTKLGQSRAGIKKYTWKHVVCRDSASGVAPSRAACRRREERHPSKQRHAPWCLIWMATTTTTLFLPSRRPQPLNHSTSTQLLLTMLSRLPDQLDVLPEVETVFWAWLGSSTSSTSPQLGLLGMMVSRFEPPGGPRLTLSSLPAGLSTTCAETVEPG